MNTNKMKDLRLQEVNLGYPTLSRADFPQGEEGDTAYRQALEKQYQELRQKQYEYTLQNEAMKMYNLSRDASVCLGNRSENICMWTGYRNYIDAAPNQAERKRRQEQVNNCAASISRDLALNDWGTRGNYDFGKRASCAITASSILCTTCAQMGYDGDRNSENANLIIPQKSPRGHVNSAANMYYDSDSIRAQKIDNPNLTQTAIKDVYHVPANTKSLDEMFQQKPCPFGVGDGISIVTGVPDEKKGTTGCHAMTIVDIQKDPSGKVISYTLQANNPAAYDTCYVGKGSKWGSKPFRGVVHTQDWMTQKIQDETASKSIADLERGIAETKASLVGGTIEKDNQCVQVNGVINDLAQTEEYYKNKGYCYNANKNHTYSHYPETYDKNMNSLQGTVDELKVAELEHINAEREQKLKKDEELLAQKEQDYAKEEQTFLTEYPDYKDKLHVNEDGTPKEPLAKPDPVEIPPETQSQDLEERARVANARKAALDKKEFELVDREHNLEMDSIDLTILQTEIDLDPKEQEKRRKQEEKQRKADEKARKEAEKNAKKEAKEQQKAEKEEDNKEKTTPKETSNDGEPTGKVTGTNQRQRADFKGAYFDAGVEENTQVEAAQKENERISEQQKKAQQSNTQTPPQTTRTINVSTLLNKQQKAKQSQATTEQPQEKEPTTTRTVHINNLLDIKRQR